jgi:hypothetical protein
VQGKMKTQDTQMPAGSSNSTGNMNKGAGRARLAPAARAAAAISSRDD